jgi:glutathione synthase/RimK-type ligase-like ATP-grasp enzyme
VILLVTHARDRHLPPVLRALERRRLRARLLDTGRFPLRGTLDLVLGGRGPSRLRVAGGPASFRAEEVAAVWWRRPRPFEPDPRMPLRHREFAFRETSEAFAGLFRCLGARWVNDPAREAEAGHKPWQLELARACGLTVPATCITNDPSRARAFLRRVGRAGAVYKSLDAAPGTWRETRPVGPEERRLLGLVRQAPVIFQERVPGVDLRVTCFGERLFAAEIDPGEAGYRDDFRIAWPRARVRPARLPREVAAGLRRLLRRLGLLYAAADLRRTPEGEVHFLEVNPSGQFRFVEERTGQPMTEALCDLLAGR